MTSQEFQAAIANQAPEAVTLINGTFIVLFHSGDTIYIQSPPLIEYTDEYGTHQIQDTSL